MTSTLPKPNITLDLQGMSCPGPLLGAKQMVDGLAEGQVLLLISDCPGTEADLFSWSRVTGNQVVASEKRSGGGRGYYIRKGHAKRPAANATLDLRGVTCPGPIVEAKKLLDSMRPNEVLRLVSDCPGVKDDVFGWVQRTGLRLIESSESAPGEFEFFIARIGAGT